MSDLNIQDLEKVAETYEELLAPALFEPWTHRLADAARLQRGQQVLDVACGTGILARTLAARVGPSGSVSGVDINPGMLAVARRKEPAIDWREGNAEALPYDDESFDAVVSQFALMLFSSPETALREMMRVLKRGGHLAVAVLDSLDNLPAYAIMVDIYERRVAPAVGEALRLPFSLGEPGQLAALSARAGIDTAEITTHKGLARFPDVRRMVLADVRGWFPFAGLHLDQRTVEAVIHEAQAMLAAFQTSDGAVELPALVHLISATKP